MKTKKILILFLTCILLISCKPTSNKQNERQESIVTEEQDSLTSEEQEYKEYFDSILDSNEEEVIVLVNKSNKYDKTDEPDNLEGIISIIDVRNVDDFSDAVEIFIPDTMLVDSLRMIAKTAETFIKWYINDNCPIDQDKLFTFSETLGYYIFDSNYGNYYLKELQETGVVADSLIRRLRRSFVASITEMETEKIGAETNRAIIGYEADILLNSQDVPSPFQIKDMKIKRFVIWKTDNILVGLGMVSLELFYENGEWKIIGG